MTDSLPSIFRSAPSTATWLWILLATALWLGAPRSSLAEGENPGTEPAATLPGAERDPSLPDDETLEKNGAIIGQIVLRVSDIFDLNNPKENNAVYRAANKLHIATRENVVRSYLLFKSGEPYSRRLLDETERNLRNTDFLYDAFVVPIAYTDNVVDVAVVTRDVWTLTGGINFSRKGGESSSGFEVEDTNFLGFGHKFSLKHTNDPDRTENNFLYDAPNLGPRKERLQVNFGDNSDGRLYAFSYSRPFISLDTSNSYGFAFQKRDYDDARYSQGVVIEDFHREDTDYNVFFGFSAGLINNHALQWSIGYAHEDRKYTANDKTRDPSQIPENETESYPWIGMRYVEDRYVKSQRISFINRTEDVNLGNELSIRLGWSDTALSADTASDELIYDILYSKGWLFGEDRFLLFDFNAEGRVQSETTENVLTGTNLQYFEPHHAHQVFYTSFFAQVGHDLDDPNLIQLGGDTGLRGYPAHVQDGDRMFLLTLEQRYYHPKHFYEFFYMGGAIFFDMGRAWDPDAAPGPHSGVLKDVGIGLRFTSSRAGKGKVLHIDAAYPLDGDDIDRTIQINMSMESSF